MAFRAEILAALEGTLVRSGGKQFLWPSHQNGCAVAFAALELRELTWHVGPVATRRGGLVEPLSFRTRLSLPALSFPDALVQSGKEA